MKSSTTNKVKKRVTQNKKSAHKAPLQEVAPSEIKNKIPVTVFITGDLELVKQYAELVATHGYIVNVEIKNSDKTKIEFQSKNIKIVSNPAKDTFIALELSNINAEDKKNNLQKMDKMLEKTTPIISSSINITATEQASWIENKFRLVGISALPSFIDKPIVEVAPTIYSPKETIKSVQTFYNSISKEIEIVQDRIGMVFPRIICQIINEAVFAVTSDIANPQDIDLVLKEGMKFPKGAFELAQQIGWNQVYAVLNSLYLDLKEERYKISPLVKQMAITGTSY